MTFKSPPEPRSPDASVADGVDPLADLVRAAASGEREALMRLLSLVAPPVTATIRVLLGPRHPELEDAVQEALLAISVSLERFRGESTFLHYARRIAVRTALALRRARDDRARQLAEARAVAPLELARAEPTGLEREQRLALFRKLLDELPDGQAESLAYRVLLEYPLPQIARETGVPINTVRSRVRLARNHLRDRILGDPALAEALLADLSISPAPKKGT
jgi:RNA polymerase sigma factor (sigma-70 family)